MAQRRALKLRLIARNDSALRQGALLIGDALERAALGEDVGRLYVVRRFSIGAVRLPAGSLPVVAEIEQRFASLRARAVHAEAPGAASAQIVWFRQGEPPIALARALALGPAPSAWFWSLALPAYSAALSRRAALQVALQAASTSRAGPAALAALVDAAGALAGGALFSLITLEDGRSLLAGLGLDLRSEPAVALGAQLAMPSFEAPAMPAHLRPVVVRWTQHWGESDPRARWLAALALLVATPSLAADPERLLRLAVQAVRHLTFAVRDVHRAPSPLLAQSAAALRSDSEASTNRGIEPSGTRLPMLIDVSVEPALGEPQRSMLDVWNGTHEDHRQAFPAEASTAGRDSESPERTWKAPETRALAPTAPESELAEDASLPPLLDSAQEVRSANASPFLRPVLETSAGGLLFLIWALRSLGIEQWFDAHPELVGAGFGGQLLLFIAARLDVPGTDPLLGALVPLASGSLPKSVHWLGRSCSPQELCGLWANACRRYCRTEARVGLRNLVWRPGLVACSPTHVDVAFPLHAADPRVRLAGLDVDPGWVPWLGRVVLFHYLEAGRDAL